MNKILRDIDDRFNMYENAFLYKHWKKMFFVSHHRIDHEIRTISFAGLHAAFVKCDHKNDSHSNSAARCDGLQFFDRSNLVGFYLHERS